MSESALLSLPLIEAGQAQKHVTHNEALLKLDALIHLSVRSRALATPPASPSEGDRYLVPSGATGAWAGQAGRIAAWQSGAWTYHQPMTGWRVWIEGEDKLSAYSGTAWIDQGAVSNLQNVPMAGINTTADSTNRLAVASPAVLLSNAGNDIRAKLNKQAAGDTASIVFQTGFSGRAEMGLAGDDDYHFKVSADGSSWTEALTINRTTGAVSLPATPGSLLSTADKQKIDGATSLAALAAMPAAAGFAYLNVAGREGVFRWDGGNHAADVSADPQQAVYVASSSDATGASGAWVRSFAGAIEASWFGVVADGVTDHSTKLQAALDFAAAQGGGTVILPRGTTRAKGLKQASHVELRGHGTGATVLKLPNGANTWIIAHKKYAENGTSAELYGGLRDLTLDGNRANNTVGSGLILRGYRYAAKNVLITNAAEHGVLVDSFAADGVTEITNGMAENCFENCYFQLNGKSGWYGNNGPGQHLSDQTIIDCVFYANGEVSGSFAQMHSERSSGFVVSRNRFYGAMATNLRLDAGGGLFVTDNVFDATNDTAATGTVTDVLVSATGWGMTVISGNQFLHHGTSFAAYGGGATALEALQVNVTPGDGDCVAITGNVFFSDVLSITGYSLTGGGAGEVSAVVGNAFSETASGSNLSSLTDNSVSNAKLRDSAALSVIGRASNATGDPADIAAAVDGQALRRQGSTLSFGLIDDLGLSHGRDLLTAMANGDFKQGSDGWTASTGWTISSDPVNAFSGNFVASCGATSGVARALFSRSNPSCAPGETVCCEVMIKTSSGVSLTATNPIVYWYDKDGGFLSSTVGAGVTGDQLTYVAKSVTATAPANAAFFLATLVVNSTAGTVYCGRIEAYRKRDAAKLIADSSVSNAQLATIASQTFKGRTSSGAGIVEDLSIAQAKGLLNLTGTNSGDQTAATVSFSPTGGLSSTTVQAALAELDAEKEVTGAAASTMSAHTAAGDPHPQYLTQAEGDGRYMAIGSGGSGDVVGPASSADNALARFDGTTGKIIQNSAVLLNDDGSLRLPDVAAPQAPAAGNVNLLAADIAGREMLAARGPAGVAQVSQPLLARTKVGMWNPPGNATTVPGVFSFVVPTAIGTATARNIATTNMLTRMRRLGYASAATAGSSAGHYVAAAQYSIGDGSGLGGFLYVVRFGVSDSAAVSGARMFVGLRNAVSAPTNVEPSTLTNAVGVAQLSTAANLQMVYGGSAAQTAIDLGANFPANTLSADIYELALFAPSTSQVIGYRVERLNSGHVASGTLTGTVGTVIPSATTLLAHTAWRCNNATALAVGIDLSSVYVETDY